MHLRFLIPQFVSSKAQLLWLLSFAMVLLQTSCNQQPHHHEALVYEKIDESLSTVATSLVSSPAVFKINTQADTLLVTRRGHALFITKNSLVGPGGQVHKGQAIIKIYQFDNKREFLGGLMQTAYLGELKEAQTAVFIQANSSEGSPLKLKQGQTAYLELGIAQDLPNANVYAGQRSPKGRLGFETTCQTENAMVSFPLGEFSNPFGECPPNFALTTADSVWAQKWAHLEYVKAKPSQYEGTLLATREFEKRFRYYCLPELVNAYRNSLNKPMWQTDLQMVDYFEKDLIARRNRFKITNPTTPNPYQNLNAYKWLLKNDTSYCKLMIKKFGEFAQERKTQLHPHFSFGKGVLNKMSRRFLGTNLTQFGWVSAMRPLPYTGMTPMRLEVTISNSTEPLPNAAVFLLLRHANTLIQALPGDANTYRFVDSKGAYLPLPQQGEATVLAFARKQNHVLLGWKNVVLAPNTSIDLLLNEVNLSELQQVVNNLN